jgi:outer membrane protein assembly factor BamA
MYNEVNCVDLTYHKVDFEGKTYSVQEAINEILDWLEKEYYPERDLREDTNNIEGFYKEYERKIRLFAVIIPYLWW